MYTFSYVGSNSIQSSSGHVITTLGRTGLRVDVNGTETFVDSEMQAPPMTIAIYSDTAKPTNGVSAADLLDEIHSALEWAGFRVDLIG